MNQVKHYCISIDKNVTEFLDGLDFSEHSKSNIPNNLGYEFGPNDVAEKLFGFKADFTKQPPFCFIKTSTRIWELFLLSNCKKDLSKTVYRELTRGFKNQYDPFEGCTCAEIGIKKGDWKDVYTKIDDESFSRKATEFTNHFTAQNRVDAGKLIPIRAKNKNTKIESRKKDKKIRSSAADFFFHYMIGDEGFNLTKKDIVKLSDIRGEEQRLVYLLEKKPNRHVFFVGLMLCLFGRSYTNDSGKKEIIGVSSDFAQRIACLLPSFADEHYTENAYQLKEEIMRKVKSKKKKEISPIYRSKDKADQKYRVSFRLDTWIHLLIESKKAF